MKLKSFSAMACSTLAVAAIFAAAPSESEAQDYFYGPPAYYAPGPVYYAPPAAIYPAPVTVYRAPFVPYYRPPLVSVHAGPAHVYVPRPWFRPRWEEKVYTPYGTHEFEYKMHRNGYVSVDYDFDD
ncbi:MAG: hypothetical protein AB7O26_15790 [Planctomycetaceae bacterium]